MEEAKEKCTCKQEWISRGFPSTRTVYVHIAWCPESYECQEYDSLPWYKKLFTLNPRNY